MLYGGIDPGNEGALVLISGELEVVQQVLMPVIDIGKGKSHRMILDKVRFLAILKSWMQMGAVYVVCEESRPLPTVMRGVVGAWKSGRAYGNIEMALIALGMTHEIASPQRWQSRMLKGIEGSDTKARAIARAQSTLPTLDLYPGRRRKAHTGLADAGCLAIYASAFSPVRKPTTRTPPAPPPRRP